MAVHGFTRDDMALFVKFAAQDELGQLELSREQVLKLVPVVEFYQCELMWCHLIRWVHQHPDLEVFAKADACSLEVEWDDSVYNAILDEIPLCTQRKVKPPGHMYTFDCQAGLNLGDAKRDSRRYSIRDPRCYPED